MRITVNSGSAIAAAAASLLIAGAVLAPTSQAATGDGHCMGANACKGQSACKGASNACKGQNACKGKGFLAMSKADCEKIPGAVFQALDEKVKPQG
jgi:hypothetical protein